MADPMKTLIPSIHREGWPWIGGFAVGALILALIWEPLGWIGLIATLWCVYFFRDPERITPERKGLLVSPADGVVQQITKAPLPSELEMGDGERTRISVFLNIFDVHVNRIPLGGTVSRSYYHQGLFLNASLDKASEDNERHLVKIDLEDGRDLVVVQIAGLVARRIVYDIKEGDVVETGQRFGIIRFGSRVDVYLPEGVEPLVIEGQRAVGGETVFADLESSESARTGSAR